MGEIRILEARLFIVSFVNPSSTGHKEQPGCGRKKGQLWARDQPEADGKWPAVPLILSVSVDPRTSPSTLLYIPRPDGSSRTVSFTSLLFLFSFICHLPILPPDHQSTTVPVLATLHPSIRLIIVVSVSDHTHTHTDSISSLSIDAIQTPHPMSSSDVLTHRRKPVESRDSSPASSVDESPYYAVDYVVKFRYLDDGNFNSCRQIHLFFSHSL